MNLPKLKTLAGKKFELTSQFHSNIDAKKALRSLKIENALFGKRKRVLFESQNQNILFKNGLYEEVISI
jgi:hypothetical protein